jgi:prevent-host-death family protein
MSDVSIRELRNHGGEIVDRAAGGERITITRDGKPVAELSPVRPELTADVILEKFRRLPPIDPIAFRADVDAAIDWEL